MRRTSGSGRCSSRRGPPACPRSRRNEQADDFKTFRQEVAGEEKLEKVDLAVADVLAPYEKQGLLKEPGPGNQRRDPRLSRR